MRIIIGIVAIFSSSQAFCQTNDKIMMNPATISTGTSSICEMHIWPAERFASMTSGFLGGGLLDAALNAKKDKNNRNQLSGGLTSEAQVDAIASLNLSDLLKIQPVNIIKHDVAIDAKLLKSIKNRNSNSKANCYYEIHVIQVLFQKAAFYGRRLITKFSFRDFGSNEKFLKEVKGMTTNNMKLFPPKEGEDIQAANDELVATFKKDFEEFANKDVSIAKKAK